MVKTLEFKGAQCFYTVEGKGRPVMLVHGFMEEGSMWNGVVNALKKSNKVIIPDLPGFGKSELTSPKFEVTMQLFSEFLKAICRAEKINSLILLGHSMGGYISLHFAEKNPEFLKGLGLINSHCYEDSEEKKANRRKTIEFIRKHGTKHFVNELYNAIFSCGYRKKYPKVVHAMLDKALKYKPEAVMAATEAMIKRKDKSTVLSNSKVPVLLISGQDDQTVPLELSLKQASLAEISDFHLFDNSKHMSVFEQKRKATLAIQNFIRFCSNRKS